MTPKRDLERLRRRRRRKQIAVRVTVGALVWTGAAVLYYVAIAFFFDTPVEYRLRHSTDRLRDDYAAMSARYDSLRVVLDNLAARDRSVFRTLFESDPYDLDADYEAFRAEEYERSLEQSSRQLLHRFRRRLDEAGQRLGRLSESYLAMRRAVDSAGDAGRRIPAIQPVINEQLTLLTASYGMRIHPFYKTLQSHQGVDYAIPEGSSVFATADGTVKDVARRSSTSGRTVVIDHGNGYETTYAHLHSVQVRRGQRVRRGDIIALSGDTGLSLAPHLHYEVRHNGIRVDPIHYFFMELSPVEYQRIIRIAQSGLQSFD